MKNLVQLSFLVISLFLFASCGNQEKENAESTSSEAQVSQEVMPEIVFENDYAKVVKVSLAPGEALAPHEGEERVIYSLTDYSIDWVEQGKKEGTKSWSKGDVHFHKAGQHSAKNSGNTTAEWLAFIKKEAELPDCGENTLENDVNSVVPDFAKQKFDNSVFNITEVSLPQGENIPMHAGVNRIIYSLTDYQVMYESEQVEKEEKSFKTGDIHWHEACAHALENTGSGEARFLVVAYKKQAQ